MRRVLNGPLRLFHAGPGWWEVTDFVRDGLDDGRTGTLVAHSLRGRPPIDLPVGDRIQPIPHG